ncbi:YggS family pyridoxal phosphate-dependent enzyme [Spongiibacter marinus]|uniref:YggS family pyridoxal phosphate-dependent enzyme n=1 Tax=Spongiibacter marinus TaxID=354246 RepID=UPI0023BAADE8|nr:YggS family pyridoxal phosphate-dependent enzyme [Spongiibacter marinus]MBM7421928.1 hypothetical protein [Spongiibacter marinus]
MAAPYQPQRDVEQKIAMTHSQVLSSNIASLRAHIAQCAADARRNPAEITLLAVSKTRNADEVANAVANGLDNIGENYLQEAREKQQALSHLDICWHFIGPIQSNKTREIAEHFSWVHSVDRLKIARRLSDQRPASLAPLNICLQVNISEETTKSGVLPSDALDLARGVAALPGLTLRGLMAIPAASTDLAEQRQAFAQLRQLRDQIASALPGLTLDTLSMGMSGDIDAAILEGSTLLRVGTAIFGPRTPATN